ncbi:Beta-lactamase OXA-18 [Methylocystis sp. MJC1]|jgi:beta-lactamase class D|uniref:class D beta-lactamase n=2 Tax=Methylocystis sp. MJC1 TaxID=2654282 RepID=UPI0013EE3DB3|nr:Beta-lactamase OXA-18 [Methylocystis sp. MJC1]MBU6527607.1 class D beta-lactamase [Methylocystis sp. MJC1]
MDLKCLAFALLALGPIASKAEARTICTMVADASAAKILVQEGECAGRVTPASTFKIALSLMGFDSGFLKDDHTPTLPYQDGYPDWGGEPWRQPADPARWMKLSVVWFSQQIALSLGQNRFQQYVTAFQYGNADVSGKPAYRDGVMGAWINSTLQSSSIEQIAFLEKVVNRQLPVSSHAFEMTDRITEIAILPSGWDVHGKTGTGSPGDDGKYDAAHAYGWFVGWATKGADKLVFARLIQDELPAQPSAGARARDGLLADFPALASRLR